MLSFFFFFKQKTAYEMRISDWSSDVCSSDLQQGDRIRRKPIADPGQQGLQIEVSLRTDEAFQLLARRPIDTAVAAPQENMLEHGIDRLPARTKIVGNPPRQRPAIRLRHTAEPEMPQNLRAMPAGGAPGKIIVVHGFGIETKLLRQIQDTVGGYRRMIRHKEAMPGEKSKLNRQSQSCRLRFAGHERDVRKTQAPRANKTPTRNAKAH